MSDEDTLRVLEADVATLRRRLANQDKRVDDLVQQARRLILAGAGISPPTLRGAREAGERTTRKIVEAKRALLDLERRAQALRRA